MTTPMTTREAIEDALHCMAFTLDMRGKPPEDRATTRAAMKLLCQQYGLPLERFLENVSA